MSIDKETTKIHLAADHAGFELKEAVKEQLDAAGWTVINHGAGSFNKQDDYPDFMHPAAQAVAGDEAAVGVIFGYSGQGEAMVANRYTGVRAAVYYGPPSHKASEGQGDELDIITLSREHNNANILSIGAGFVDQSKAVAVIEQWLETDFTAETRHQRRIEKIDDNFQGV